MPGLCLVPQQMVRASTPPTIMSTAEKYLKPEVIRQIKRLDLRAQFIVKGFLHGLQDRKSVV